MICPNCQFIETEDAGFCSKCGQKFGPAKLTIRQFLGDLIDHVFNLDTNFFYTLKEIFIPAQLTLDYFAGHRKRFYHPLRLFFFLMVIYLGLVGSLIPYESIFQKINQEKNDVIAKHNNRLKLEAVAKTHTDFNSRIAIDSAREWLLSASKDSAAAHRKKDTVPAKKTKAPVASLDSLHKEIRNNVQLEVNGNKKGFNFFDLSEINGEDLILLSIDSLVSKYHITNYFEKLLFGQAQKFSSDPKGMIQFILGNVSWMMIVMIPLLAVFLKILFRRRNRYYIEHLFFLYHWHAFAFLFGSILVVFFRNYLQRIYNPFLLLVIVFGFIAWKRYYKQGWIKSVIKFGMMGIAYFFLFMILIILTAAISFGFY